MKVSIIIKALNEEANIARAIESCLSALKNLDGEIVVADCLSDDRTVEIASCYPVKIVQLDDPKDRGCGAAPQLGYQYCEGEFIYLIDGDMSLHGSFLAAALSIFEQDESVAGVGGIVRDMHLANHEFASRAARRKKDLQPGEVDRLDGGGLYRRAAIESVRYFSDRNLHGFEELELATRLRGRGWRLVRLNRLAVDHYGYTIGAYQLLWRRFTGGYALGAGEIARATYGQPSFLEVLMKVRTLWLSALVIVWILTVLLGFTLTTNWVQRSFVSGSVFLAPLIFMSLRRGSLKLGVYAVTVWVVLTVSVFRGLFRSRVDPMLWISSRTIHATNATGQIGN